MYVRSYKSVPQGQTHTEEEITPLTAPNEETYYCSEPKEKKSRYKARRKMPDFRSPCATKDPLPDQQNESLSSHVPQKSTHVPLYTQSEMLVLAIAVLLLLEGVDDILILALGYTLCP